MFLMVESELQVKIIIQSFNMPKQKKLEKKNLKNYKS